MTARHHPPRRRNGGEPAVKDGKLLRIPAAQLCEHNAAT